MNLDKFKTYWEDNLPEGYEALTYCFDMMNGERGQLIREAERLEEKGVDVCLVMYDTRKGGDPVTVGKEKVSFKRSVWAEIWKKEEASDE